MSNLQLAILGPFVLTEDGQPVELNIAKLQALLGYLALTGRALPREQLLGLLWAESHPDAARKNLRNRLWQLRQVTKGELIVTTGEQLALAANVQCDILRFTATLERELRVARPDLTALATSVDLWRGPLLDGLQLQEAPDFELWLSQQRERLRQLYLQAVDRLITYAQSQGKWQHTVALAQKALAHDPLHEPLYQQLMTGYAQLGQRAEALQQYTRLHELLAAELAVAPLPATELLRDQIANGFLPAPPIALPPDQSAGKSEPREQTQPTQAIAGQTDLLQTANKLLPHKNVHPFIGRQKQLAALTQALQESRQGSRVVLLSGELGMGKSTLWQQWVSLLRVDESGAVVLATRCLNTTQSMPFEPMQRLLNTVECREQWAHIGDALLPIWQDELLQLAPTLQAFLPHYPDAASSPAIGETVYRHDEMATTAAGRSPKEEQGLLAEALTQFLRAFRGEPLILFVDDSHWADSATVDWLLYLTDRMAQEPLLLILACRPTEMTAHFTKIVAQWQREGLLLRLELPRLTEQESATLLTTLGAKQQMVPYLYNQSGGNPYYLIQLSDVAVDGIPSSLVDLVQARLRYLDERWQPVLQAAAILEPTIDLALLSAASGRTEEETVDALDGLLASAILVEKGSEYEFAHPLVATVMREGLSNGRRRLLHRRAAEGLSIRYRGAETKIAGPLAHHFAAAGDRDQAAHFALVAGNEALRIGAANEACAFYQQAHQLAPSAESQLGLGQALLLLPGQINVARQAMEAALLLYEQSGDESGIIKTGLHLAASYLSTQEGSQVLYWARRVLPNLETIADPVLHASAHYLMGTAQFRNGYTLGEAEMHFAAALKLVDDAQLDSDIGLMATFEWGNLCLERGTYGDAIAKFQEARQFAMARKSIFFEVLARNNLAFAYLQNGDTTIAQEALEQALALADTYALQSVMYYLWSTSGEIALATAAHDRAEAAFYQAIESATKFDNPTFVANLWAQLGQVAKAKGDYAQAIAYLERAKKDIAHENIPYLQTQIDLWLAATAIAQHNFAGARSYLHTATVQLTNRGYHKLEQMASELSQMLLGSSEVHVVDEGSGS